VQIKHKLTEYFTLLLNNFVVHIFVISQNHRSFRKVKSRPMLLINIDIFRHKNQSIKSSHRSERLKTDSSLSDVVSVFIRLSNRSKLLISYCNRVVCKYWIPTGGVLLSKYATEYYTDVMEMACKRISHICECVCVLALRRKVELQLQVTNG
jgi:hypothetical protein